LTVLLARLILKTKHAGKLEKHIKSFHKEKYASLEIKKEMRNHRKNNRNGAIDKRGKISNEIDK
jgi:hypothetical protein